MARPELRLVENAPGDLFVDSSCIDCDLCRQLAPATFARSSRRGTSFVQAQPPSPDEERRALLALVACPTASIGAVGSHDTRSASRAFPIPVTEDVSFCGYASPSSYGASSWLVRRAGGNVLVDSPRAASPLLARLAELGGVELMFLTHRDDVADHAAFRERFGCRRVLHEADVGRDTAAVEARLVGDAPVELAPDLLAIPVPGHTRGSAALLFRETYLFTGDHLWADDDETGLDASRSVCWWSWPAQVRSIERLLDHRFEWVLPGHGRPLHARSKEAMRAALERLLARLGRSG